MNTTRRSADRRALRPWLAVVVGWVTLAVAIVGASGLARGAETNLSSADQLITVSLVPDGTEVVISNSSLIGRVGKRVGGEAALRRLIAASCQRWVTASNLNFAFVTDSGEPLGTRGLPRQDDRFGDIRIAAVSLPAGVRGVAFSRESVVAGTWAGDIVLNADYPFTSRTLIEVLVHELGHSLGFDHVEGVDSVLNPSNQRTALTTFDRQRLIDRWGTRRLDPNELERSNDAWVRATRLNLGYTRDGELPVLAFGDLASVGDVDLFEFRPEAKIGDRIAFQFRTLGNSMVAASWEVLDDTKRVVAKGTVSWESGGIGRVSLPIRNLTRRSYLRIRAANDLFAVGSYAVVAYYPNRLTTPTRLINQASRWNYSHLDQSEARYFFREGPDAYFFAEDLLADDVLANAVPLDPQPVPESADLHLVDASISYDADRDFYRFDVSSENDGRPLTITLLSRDDGRLIPSLEVMTAAGASVTHRIISDGNGLLVVQVDAIEAGTYAVAVQANPRSVLPHTTGNYSLELRCDRPTVLLTPAGFGTIFGDEPLFHTMRVAESQMFHFGFSAAPQTATETLLVATLYDELGEPVHRVATRPGDFRSSQSVMLSPGSYVLRIEAVTPDGSAGAGTDYVFAGVPDSDNEGPGLLDPTLSPFPKCDPLRDVYCYPEFSSDAPFIWVDGISPDLSPPTDPASTWDDVDRFYWPGIFIV